MIINGTEIVDTFAEAFKMRATRLLITAANDTWANHAAASLTGFATSVIGCGCEAGIERRLTPEESPDGRPGLSVLLFAVSSKELAKQVERRVGQCVLTAPTSAIYAGMEGDEEINLVRNIRFFGDGHQIAKVMGGRRYWRVPVMDGEFLGEESAGITRAVGGGNFLVLAETQATALDACEAAIEAMRRLPNVIMPFPGGVVRSGSKVGSRYKALMASTNDAYCPTLRGQVDTALPEAVGAVLEIVVNGLTEHDVAAAMRAGITAVCERGRPGGIHAVTAGNYGGKLGQYRLELREVMA